MIKKHLYKAKTITEGVLRNGRKEIFGVFKALKERKFEGNKGIAIKNSAYQLLTTAIGKGGTLLFTIIIARMLMPELFGLYSLALSTTVVFSAPSDLGLGTTLIRFVSKSLGKNKPKEAKSYFSYLLKAKAILSITSAALLLLSAKFIANNYYQKPISLALIAGAIYIVLINFTTLFEVLFQSANNFKQAMYKEAIFQLSRLILIPLAILLTIQKFSTEISLFWIISSLALCYLITLIFISRRAYKTINFLKFEGQQLSITKKKEVNRFWALVSTTVLSGIFLGYVDTIILGRYVSASYIGFYQAALNLISSIIPLIPISTVLFPIFSRLKGERLEKGFNRSIRFSLLLSSFFFVASIIFSNLVVKLVYGSEYLPSSLILKIFALNIFLIPISALFESYFVSIGKPQVMAKYLIFSTTINLVLNYLFVANLVKYSEYYAIMGSAFAVLISRTVYLILQITKRKKSVHSTN